VPSTRKRVQKYCFFFTYANFLAKKCKKNAIIPIQGTKEGL